MAHPTSPGPDRNRSRVRVVAGAAAVAAALVVAAAVAGHAWTRGEPGSSGLEPRATPTPTTTPTSSPTRAPFATGAPLRTFVDERGNLYLDGVHEPGSWNDATTLGDLTLAYFDAPAATKVALFVRTRRVGTLERTDDGANIEVSPDRRTIAWVEPEGTVGSIIVAAVSARGLREVGRLTVATLLLGVDDEERERLLRVADDGTVTYGGVIGGHAWRPGGRPAPVDVSAYLYGPAGFPGRADVRLNPSGTWGAWLVDRRAPRAAGDGSASYRAVALQQPGRDGTRIRIAMPPGDDELLDLYWESDSDVVLRAYDGRPFSYHYLRCTVHGSCEHAPGWTDH